MTDPIASTASDASTSSETSQPVQQRPTWHVAVALLIVLAAILVAYQSSLGGGFVWDDRNLIEKADSVHQIQPIYTYLGQSFWNQEDHQRTVEAYYRPLITFSYALEWQLWNAKPFGFHLTNILAHCLNCLLLFFLARRFGAKRWWAICGVALFGLLPRLTECVAWISGRTDIFAAFFVLSALLIHPMEHLKSKDEPSTSSVPLDSEIRPLSLVRCVLAACLIFLGLISKEVAAAGIVAIVAAEWVRLERVGFSKWKSAILRLLPLVILSGVYTACRLSAHVQTTGVSFVRDDFIGHVLTILAAIGCYAQMGILFLAPHIQIGDVGTPETFWVILGAILLFGFLVALWKIGLKTVLRWQGLPLLALGAISLGLVLQIIPLNIHELACDRFIYVPALAFFAILAMAASKWIPPSGRMTQVSSGIAGIVAVACFSGTVAQAELWTSEIPIFQQGCEKAAVGNSCFLLSTALIEAGQPDQALLAIDKVQRLERDTNSKAWLNYSKIRVVHGRAQALANLSRCQESSEILIPHLKDFSGAPFEDKAQTLAALCLIRLGKTDEARALVRTNFGHLKKGKVLAASFEKLLQDIQPTVDQLGGFPLKSPETLSDQDLVQALHLAQTLNDRTLATKALLQILVRDGFPLEAKVQAQNALLTSGTCPVLREHSDLLASLPDRCALVPEATFH